MITPAEQWREGLPSGNGTIGALVYGGVSVERVVFNHNELWYRGRVADIPDMSAELLVVRKLFLEGEYWQAYDHYRTIMREKKFSGSNGTYHPAFDLNLLLTADVTDDHPIFNPKCMAVMEEVRKAIRGK